MIVVAVVALSTIPGGPAGDAAAVIQTPTFQIHAAPSSLASSNNAGEPSVGVNWNTGAVMYQAYDRTYRISFDATGASTWADATSVAVPNLDPILFTDSRGHGRTFAGGLQGSCSVLAYTDNDGQGIASWTQMTNSCSGSTDHESIGGGAWHSPSPLGATYDRAVYYCAQEGNILCATSTNGGLSFLAPVIASGSCAGLHGHIKVGPDGYAYVPVKDCGRVGFIRSSDNGGSWQSFALPSTIPNTSPGDGFDPSIAIANDNTVYYSWMGNDHHTYVAVSKDHGATWTNVRDVSTSAIPQTTFQSIVAGDGDRAAVAYLGSTTNSNGFGTSFPGTWDLYVSYTYDGGSSWSTVKATSDPVQRGYICDGGFLPGCDGGRNLLDFMDASVEKSGKVVVAFADGCIGACAGPSGTISQSVDAYATIARQTGGSGVFAINDPVGPSAPGAPTLTGTAGDTQNTLSWSTPANGGAAITGYKLYRNGALYQSLGVQNSYVDAGLTNGQTYTYEVSAVNSVGEGAKSNSVALTPFHVSPPGAPQGLTAKHANGPNSGKIKLDWTAPASNGGAAVTSYKIYRGTSAGSLAYLTTVGNVLTYTDSGLTTGTTYYYQVSAVNSAGEGARSNTASAVG